MAKARWGRITHRSVVADRAIPVRVTTVRPRPVLRVLPAAWPKRCRTGNHGELCGPGFIDTDMTKKLDDKQRQAMLDIIPTGRLGDPGEVVGRGVSASDGAAYVTGETIQQWRHVHGIMPVAGAPEPLPYSMLKTIPACLQVGFTLNSQPSSCLLTH